MDADVFRDGKIILRKTKIYLRETAQEVSGCFGVKSLAEPAIGQTCELVLADGRKFLVETEDSTGSRPELLVMHFRGRAVREKV